MSSARSEAHAHTSFPNDRHSYKMVSVEIGTAQRFGKGVRIEAERYLLLSEQPHSLVGGRIYRALRPIMPHYVGNHSHRADDDKFPHEVLSVT
jgi:hypothetical protein